MKIIIGIFISLIIVGGGYFFYLGNTDYESKYNFDFEPYNRNTSEPTKKESVSENDSESIETDDVNEDNERLQDYTKVETEDEVLAEEKSEAVIVSNECRPFKRNLNLGSEGEDVSILQQYLVSKGFLSTTYQKGFFDSKTESALFNLQKSYWGSASIEEYDYGTLTGISVDLLNDLHCEGEVGNTTLKRRGGGIAMKSRAFSLVTDIYYNYFDNQKTFRDACSDVDVKKDIAALENDLSTFINCKATEKSFMIFGPYPPSDYRYWCSSVEITGPNDSDSELISTFMETKPAVEDYTCTDLSG